LIQDPDDILELARHLAGDVLPLSANQGDRAEVVSRSHLGRPADSAALVEQGSWSLLELQHGQRLLREAGFLLVIGPAIRASLIKRRLSAPE
jgi:hypothetical protein